MPVLSGTPKERKHQQDGDDSAPGCPDDQLRLPDNQQGDINDLTTRLDITTRAQSSDKGCHDVSSSESSHLHPSWQYPCTYHLTKRQQHQLPGNPCKDYCLPSILLPGHYSYLEHTFIWRSQRSIPGLLQTLDASHYHQAIDADVLFLTAL
jgi:hypothetical protein